MRQIKPFSDKRLENVCSYCGEKPETKDHVPSKILLDDPFPENLPVIPCCLKCNHDFSLDEEYFACALECILHQTSEIEKLERKKVKAILLKKENLRKRIENSIVKQEDGISFQIEKNRIKNIIIKLAKGHAKYENSEPQLDDPTNIWAMPLNAMTEEELSIFFAPTKYDKAPEIGSRFTQNFHIDLNNNVFSHWTVVQENNYEYSVSVRLETLIVKIVIWNYLAVQATWS